MTTRRPIRYTPTLQHLADYLDAHRGEMELGWSVLRHELTTSGWPARRDPERAGHPVRECDHDDDTCTCKAIDYNDPTGEMAEHIGRLHTDREKLEDYRQQAETALRQIVRITDRYRPQRITDPDTGRTFMPQPACTAPGCDQPVETRRTKSGFSYVGMAQVAGVWVAMADQRPRCAAHRKRDERAA